MAFYLLAFGITYFSDWLCLLIDERRALTLSAIYFSVMCVIVLACVLTWFVVVHDDILPALFVDQIGLTALGNRVTSMDFAISLVALVVLWLRQRSVLDHGLSFRCVHWW